MNFEFKLETRGKIIIICRANIYGKRKLIQNDLIEFKYRKNLNGFKVKSVVGKKLFLKKKRDVCSRFLFNSVKILLLFITMPSSEIGESFEFRPALLNRNPYKSTTTVSSTGMVGIFASVSFRIFRHDRKNPIEIVDRGPLSFVRGCSTFGRLKGAGPRDCTFSLRSELKNKKKIRFLRASASTS